MIELRAWLTSGCLEHFEHFYPTLMWCRLTGNRRLCGLTSAANDADEQAFLITLRRMVAQLHDGHGNVFIRLTRLTIPFR
jgi:hypothetical protein